MWFLVLLLGVPLVAVFLYYLRSTTAAKNFKHEKTNSVIPVAAAFPNGIAQAMSSAKYQENVFDSITTDVAAVNVFGSKYAIFVKDIEEVKRILNSKDKFGRPSAGLSEGMKELTPVHGLATDDETEWKRQRKILNTAFDLSHLQQLIPLFEHYTKKLIHKWSTNDTTPTTPIMTDIKYFTNDVIGKSAFGMEFNCIETNGTSPVFQAMDAVNKSRTAMMLALIPGFLSTKWGKDLKAKIDKVRQLCYEVVATRRKNYDTPPVMHDLLEIMLQKSEEDGSYVLNERQIRDNAFFFLVAGSETTAIQLEHIFYQLAKHPSVQQKLLQELASVDEPLSFSSLNELEYLHCVVKESLRIQPSAFVVSKEVKTDEETICGYKVPKDTLVLIPIHLIQREVSIFGNDATEFKPERWQMNSVTKQMQNYWLPFSIGPHDCIGKNFALLEIKVVIALVLKAFHLDFAKPTEQFQTNQIFLQFSQR